jgi:hypothetical protein
MLFLRGFQLIVFPAMDALRLSDTQRSLEVGG